MRKALRAGLAGALSLALVAAQDPPQVGQAVGEADYPDPPAIVAERIVDGRFEPGHFEYLRGYFPEASAEEKAQYAELEVWLEDCRTEGRERLDTELAALGVTLTDDRFVSAQAPLCRQVFPAGQFQDRFATYAQLRSASLEARLVFSTLVESIRLAELRVVPAEPTYAEKLRVRTLGEQLLRISYRWGRGPVDDIRVPQLSEDERVVFNALVIGETRRADYENTSWLKARVEEAGWPTISQVGQRASGDAWLLVQHADADPAFQLKALRLMEPLIAQDEVSEKDYAYLYDRIMLKLNGKQRYGTQVQCLDGKLAPQPLEEPERLDELRAEVDLSTFAEYLELFPATCGS
ncbi:MAG: DUF6624 domain-containing protein [Pseudomonadota bacterium]